MKTADPSQRSARTDWTRVKAHLGARMDSMQPGEPLPAYEEIAEELGCSVGPVKHAMRELGREGRVSLQRGRRARVLWNNSFVRSATSRGDRVRTVVFQSAYRGPEPYEKTIWSELGLPEDEECIVCGRVRIVGAKAIAMQRCYVNPGFFPQPDRFFLDHDVVTGSLSEAYASLGHRPLSVRAVLKVGLADDQERRLMSLKPGTPVLRSRQLTIVDRQGTATPLEVMYASYTQDIDYAVERLPLWSSYRPHLGGACDR